MRLNSLDRLILRLLRRGWSPIDIASLLRAAAQQMLRDRIQRQEAKHNAR
jgi:hypothetical protein